MIPIPIPANGLKTVGEWVAAIAHRMDEHSKAQKKDRDEALNALMEAVTTTRRYLADIRTHPENQSVNKQEKITQLWKEAGRKILPLDGDAAGAFLLKAEYWADPDGWDAAGKDHYLIDLDRISELGRRALI